MITRDSELLVLMQDRMPFAYGVAGAFRLPSEYIVQ